jgi:hypothetical protein
MMKEPFFSQFFSRKGQAILHAGVIARTGDHTTLFCYMLRAYSQETMRLESCPTLIGYQF